MGDVGGDGRWEIDGGKTYRSTTSPFSFSMIAGVDDCSAGDGL